MRIHRTVFWLAGVTGVAAAGVLAMSVLRPFPLQLDRLETALAARVYARPLELRPGIDVDAIGLEPHLRSLDYREGAGPEPRRGEYVRSADRLALGLRGFRAPAGPVAPRPVRVELRARSRIAALRDAEGRPLERVLVEPLLLAELHGAPARSREPVRLEEVPAHLIDAVLVVEDRRFFAHGGLDLRRIVGAGWANLRAGRIVQGGSTITQQLVKNLLLEPERSFARKLREATLALLLEQTHTKQQILEAYLNEVYLGQQGGVAIHGFGRAAQHYFGKPVAELDVAEAALLAGLIQAPMRWSPFERPDAVRARRNHVLADLHEAGHIDAATWQRAREAPLGVRPERPPSGWAAPWIVGLAEEALARRFERSERERGGLEVWTTLDPTAQGAAEASVERGLVRLERDHERLRGVDPPLEAALVALDPRDGSIRALVGGRDWSRSQFDRATRARRQPGSAFKPIVALAALSTDGSGGAAFTLATRIEDEPFELVAGGEVWEPSNHDGAHRGLVTLREAIEQSLNVPFARLGQRLGAGRIVRTAERLGITSPLAPVPSLSLGAFEVTPLELTGAYAVLASGGERSEVRAIDVVFDRAGRVRMRPLSAREPVVDAPVAYLVTSALQGAVERGTAARVRRLGVPGVVAGKTGSTNDYRDAWFVGFTSELVVGVWVGFDDGRPVGLPGAAAALPIFADFVKAIGVPGGERSFPEPPGLTRVAIDAHTGLRANQHCPGVEEIFLAGTEPREACPEPLPRGFARGLPWRWRRAPGLDRRVPAPDHCSVQVRSLAGFTRQRGRFEVGYRVTGEAGDTAVLWLAARTRSGEYVSGPGIQVAPGPFHERVELRLPETPTRLLAVLEVGERRCADRAPLPGG